MWAPICDLGKEKEIKSMKIKRKMQKNLPQLIEWAKENDIKNKIFISKRNYYNVGFDIHGFIYFNSSNTMPLDELFTVTTEEEITEDTELYGLVELGNDGAGDDFFFSRGLSIKDCKDEFTQAFYILNDDLTMTLIWHDGKLVE